MNILLIHQFASFPGEPGHPRCFDLAQELSREHHVELLTGNQNYWSGKTREKRTQEKFSVHLIATSRGLHETLAEKERMLTEFFFACMTTRLEKKPDIIIASSPSLHEAFAGYLLSVLHGAEFVFEARDLWPEYVIELGRLKNPLKAWLAERIAAHVYVQAKKIVCISPQFPLFLVKKYGVKKEKISIIPHYVITPGKNDGHQNSIVVGMSGVLNHQYDYETLLTAAALLRENQNIKFLIVGDGDLKNEIREKIRALKLTNVILEDSQAAEAMPDVLSSIDIGLINLKPGKIADLIFPRRLMDYLSAGKPVIITGNAMADLLREAHCGFSIPPKNPKKLAETILLLSKNKKKRLQMGESGKRYALKKFGKEKFLTEYKTVIFGHTQ